ncbi:MAG: hypothetical protein FJ302_20350 [Planctomycetes bacterium]|nr:hypothetical protein [Planctomycetota bacterium]
MNVDASRGIVKVAIGIDKLHESGKWPFKANLPHWMVQDRSGQTHLEKGFHFDDCEAVNVDGIEHNVEWKAADLESLMGKKVRLDVMAHNADLYGLRFK